MTDFLAALGLGTQAMLVVTVVLFTLSGIDDLVIDVYYVCRQLWVLLYVRPRWPRLREEQLLGAVEKPIAVIVPAWQEAPVIGKMIDNTVRTLRYSKYTIFVGTYPNDPDTQLEVERARERYHNVERIVCPKDGPTNKADCLNWIIQGVRHHEKATGTRFAIFVMHDAEDIVHPLSLKLFNYLMPRFAMIQIPVFSLPRRWYEFTAGVYMDEFAELHSKDLIVRERLGKNVPSAGVGTAFSHQAVEALGMANENQLFSLDSLTEDYDFGFRLRAVGLQSIFVRFPYEREVVRKSRWTGKERTVRVADWIATREYFPSEFWLAVRQKTRWVIGIALQGWANLGWKGSWRTKYILFRDRKTLFTSQLNVLGYLLVLLVLGFWLGEELDPDGHRFVSLSELQPWVQKLLWLNGGFLLLRLVQRFVAVTRIYGPLQGLLSAPRLVWGNFINFFACWRALEQYASYLRTGKLIKWDKTDHVYPNEEDLVAYRRRLGDLLLERRLVTVEALDRALDQQKRDGRPLGRILVESGLVREEEMVQVLGAQLQLAVREVDPYSVPEAVLRRVPRDVAREFGIVPIAVHANGRIEIASSSLLTRAQLDDVEGRLGHPVDLCLTTASDVAFAIHRCYPPDAEAAPAARERPLGQKLIDAGVLTREQLDAILRDQRKGFRRLGDVLLDLGMVTRAQLDEAVLEAARGGRYIGDCLIDRGWLTRAQLDEALREQRARNRHLGEMLLERELVTPKALDEALEPPAE
ncbi:MAG: glycosyl transferase family protein [Thermodesulfobacteriota bacterium]